MRRSARCRLWVVPAVLLAGIGVFGSASAHARPGDVEALIESIPPGAYRVQRWLPPPTTTGPQFFYLLTMPAGPEPAIRERFFVTDLGLLYLDAIARDIKLLANQVPPADIVVDRLRASDGTVSAHVVRTRGVRFSVTLGRGRQPAVYLHAAETFESDGGGGM